MSRNSNRPNPWGHPDSWQPPDPGDTTDRIDPGAWPREHDTAPDARIRPHATSIEPDGAHRPHRAERRAGHMAARGPLRVPQITALFWLVKGLSTAVGESTSDFLVHAMNPVVAVGLGFVGFVIALALQFRRGRYYAWTYWFAVVMVGVFGTMAADVLHVGFGVSYIASSVLYAVVLAAVFVTWYRTEHSLSIHTIDSVRREAFYWAAVCATFAMGTAVGDLTAVALHLGYLLSLALFAVMITIPALGYRRFGWNPILAFWFAYVVTRPLGASLADWLGKPTPVGGLGWGDGPVSAVLAALIACAVAYLAATRRDVQDPQRLA